MKMRYEMSTFCLASKQSVRCKTSLANEIKQHQIYWNTAPPPVTITVTRDNKSQSGKKSVGNFMQMFLYHYAFLEHFGPF